jgi:hypothetical protein
MNGIRRFFLPILTFIIVVTAWQPAQAQSTDVQFFPDTGHNVRGIFLKFYKAVRDPQLVYGYPITEQMTSRDGKTVQYFQRARFEMTPTQSVQLSALGLLTYQPKSPMTITNPNACQMFPPGKYPVCLTFLDFYKAKGGVNQFGYPISPFESSDGLIVQYFQFSRFEWRADRPADQRVVISDLGRIYFAQLQEDSALLKAINPPDATINPVLSMNVRAFVLKAVTLKSGQQTIYVIAQNQISKPLSNASGEALVQLPDGTSQKVLFTTNASGIAIVSFNFNSQKSGELVPIDVTVNYQGIIGTTKTSFMIWF